MLYFRAALIFLLMSVTGAVAQDNEFARGSFLVIDQDVEKVLIEIALAIEQRCGVVKLIVLHEDSC